MKLETYLYTSEGRRKHNEDSAGYRIEDDQGIFLAADGLGGHAGGARASAQAVEGLVQKWSERSKQEFEPCQWLDRSVREVNREILENQRGSRDRMKTTLTALLVNDDRAAWVNVGDSRIYYLTEGQIHQVTQDHSIAYKKYQAGEITRNDIKFDEERPNLLRAVGDELGCIPETGSLEEGKRLMPQDSFLLCTDGFWEYLDEEEILIDFLKSSSSKEWVELMLVRIITRMGPECDNLTVLGLFIG